MAEVGGPKNTLRVADGSGLRAQRLGGGLGAQGPGLKGRGGGSGRRGGREGGAGFRAQGREGGAGGAQGSGLRGRVSLHGEEPVQLTSAGGGDGRQGGRQWGQVSVQELCKLCRAADQFWRRVYPSRVQGLGRMAFTGLQ